MTPADAIASAIDAGNNASVDYLVKKRRLLKMNETNVVIWNDVIYPIGTLKAVFGG
jgi:hypothetical protein